MHEMSLAASLIDIIREEMRKISASKLLLVRVRYGALSNVVPEALRLGFEVTASGTEVEGARLELVEEALKLACGGCSKHFLPEPSPIVLFSACPFCGEEIGHKVLAGKGLYIDNIEVE